jgi:hypothetical protein
MELSHHCNEVVTREFPFEGDSDTLVVLLETQESILDFLQGTEVVWRKHLAFNDGEVDLDLIEPARVNRSVHRDEIREGGSCAGPVRNMKAICSSLRTGHGETALSRFGSRPVVVCDLPLAKGLWCSLKTSCVTIS